MGMKRLNWINRQNVIMVMILLVPAFAFSVQVTATVDANRLAPNETFILRVEAQDAKGFPEPDITPLQESFTVISGPAQQTNYQWINGKQASSKSLTWTLLPNGSGNITIPALSVKIDRKILKTKPINIVVGRESASSSDSESNDEVFIIAELDKDNIYLGEQVIITYKLYTRVNLRGLEYIEQPKLVGFWVEDLYSPSQPQFREVSVEGVSYQVATLYKAALFPTRSGEINLAPMIIRAQIEVRRSQRSRRSMFDDFFADPFAVQTVQRVVRTTPKTLNVLPYPSGKPADFAGAVGVFTLASAVDQEVVNVNEAITLTLKLSGTGNLNLFDLPELEFPNDLEVFPPTTDFEKEPFRDDISGTKTKAYILIPRQPGEFMLPATELSYFDPGKKQWQKTITKPIILEVLSSETAVAGSANLTKEEVALLGKDIRYFKTDLPEWNYNSNRIDVIKIIILYLLAIAGFSGPELVRQFNTSSQNNFARKRSRKALRMALKNLGQPVDDIAASATQIIYQYMQSKLNLTNANLDPILLEGYLENKIAEDTITELVKILHRCDADRFAPGVDSSGSDIITSVRRILEKVDTELR